MPAATLIEANKRNVAIFAVYWQAPPRRTGNSGAMTDFDAPQSSGRLPDLSQQREEYETAGLDVADVAADPLDQFSTWFTEANDAGVYEPNAMVVSTVSADGRPDGRVVLVKAVDKRGIVFYTNYESAKGQALDHVGFAAANFAWLPLHRQVRISGAVERVSSGESDAYFSVRPRGSQIGAWASQQSRPIDDRSTLEQQWADVDARFGDAVSRPPHWGGYRIKPDVIEFWQGRRNRMHDRVRYDRVDDGWTRTRLQP